jgi:hypothetical protein
MFCLWSDDGGNGRRYFNINISFILSTIIKEFGLLKLLPKSLFFQCHPILKYKVPTTATLEKAHILSYPDEYKIS